MQAYTLIEEVKDKSKIKDLTGQRFGRLVALRLLGTIKVGNSKDRTAIWECICDCGNHTQVKRSALRSGATVSCGCWRSELASQNLSALNKSNRKYSDLVQGASLLMYKKGAKYRGLEFLLTEEQFFEIINKPCHYCGNLGEVRTRSGSYKSGEGSKTWTRETRMNGIDRVDSSKGYTLNNVVPCCSTCNVFKMDMPLEDFLSHVMRISEFQMKSRQGVM